jgi:hypothetical protein
MYRNKGFQYLNWAVGRDTIHSITEYLRGHEQGEQGEVQTVVRDEVKEVIVNLIIPPYS